MNNPTTVLFTLPERNGDPTQYTAIWGRKAVAMAKGFGYDIKILEKDDVTYKNVTETIKKYNPRLYVHFGHGCGSSLQGQYECAIVRKYTVDELICLAESPNTEDRQRLIKLLNPLGELSCPGICALDNDPCSPLCTYDTNVNLLKGSIILAVACHSASQLGRCAINYGVQTYIGETDLLMFPVDSLKSQDIFGEVQLTFLKELLMGKSIQEAEQTMSELEDSYIRRFKKTKYIALPMLWNKIHRKILGDKNAMIYE